MRSLDPAPVRRSVAPLLVCIGLTLGGSSTAQERPNTPEFREACDRLVCQCGCHKTVSTCDMENCHSATPIREEVWSRLQGGESIAAIVDVFRQRYGLTILSQPPTTGFHLTAWVMPFVFLIGGAVFIFRVLRSWKAGNTGRVEAEVPAIDAHHRARIEKELRELN